MDQFDALEGIEGPSEVSVVLTSRRGIFGSSSVLAWICRRKWRVSLWEHALMPFSSAVQL